MVAPLTNLTKMRSGPFVWSPEAERAFQALKVRFTSAPILTLPDPCLPFVVEVDASDVAVCAVLSQSLADGKLHPCAFLSSRLSPAERNYDVGDRELLAIKMALEEWRHWLEGAQHPFLVWTIKIWNMCRRPGVSTLDRLGGPFSSIVSILCSLIVLVLKIRSQMLCSDSSRTLTMKTPRQQSFQIPRLWLLCDGELRRWYDKPRGWSQILVMVLREDFLFQPLYAHKFYNGDIPPS